jgi:hypothetical protein
VVAGGLPDASVTNDDLATGIASSKLTGALPAISGASLTSLTSGNLTGALPAISGALLTSLTSGNLSGALPVLDGSSLTGIQGFNVSSGQNQYDGSTTGNITISPGFAPTALILWMVVQNENFMSIGYSRKTGASSADNTCITWRAAQSGDNNWGYNDTMAGKLGFGSDKYAYLGVTAWSSTSLTLTKTTSGGGSGATTRYMYLVMG